jgi:hypothetical protein
MSLFLMFRYTHVREEFEKKMLSSCKHFQQAGARKRSFDTCVFKTGKKHLSSYLRIGKVAACHFKMRFYIEIEEGFGFPLSSVSDPVPGPDLIRIQSEL